MRTCPRTTRRAFSLVELVLVLSILAALAGIALPRHASAVARYRADAAARRVAADLAHARSLARTSSQARTIVFDLSGSRVRILGTADLNRSSAAYVTELSREPYRARLVSADFAGKLDLTFNGYGVPASGGLVELECGVVRRSVELLAQSGEVIVR